MSKGVCDLVICQICNIEMSFGRIKNHIKSRHTDITVNEYILKYYTTLPLHNPCIVCQKSIVYKYKTCSKECSSIQRSEVSKNVPKPVGFMNCEHKLKLSKSLKGKPGKFTGHKHTEKTKEILRNNMVGKKIHLGYTQSDHQKKIVSQAMLNYYKNGNVPWTKTNPHTLETINKIISHRPMNKLEGMVRDILVNNEIPFIYQFYLNRNNTVKSYDFKIGNILLEIDGDYYHGGPGCNKHFFKLDEVKTNDDLKNTLALNNGYKIVRIWESEIKSNPDIVINRINEHI